jgi:hypothetical protein
MSSPPTPEQSEFFGRDPSREERIRLLAALQTSLLHAVATADAYPEAGLDVPASRYLLNHWFPENGRMCRLYLLDQHFPYLYKDFFSPRKSSPRKRKRITGTPFKRIKANQD